MLPAWTISRLTFLKIPYVATDKKHPHRYIFLYLSERAGYVCQQCQIISERKILIPARIFPFAGYRIDKVMEFSMLSPARYPCGSLFRFCHLADILPFQTIALKLCRIRSSQAVNPACHPLALMGDFELLCLCLLNEFSASIYAGARQKRPVHSPAASEDRCHTTVKKTGTLMRASSRPISFGVCAASGISLKRRFDPDYKMTPTGVSAFILNACWWPLVFPFWPITCGILLPN